MESSGGAQFTSFRTFPSARAPSSNLQIQAISKLKEEILGSDFDLAVFLGESPESVRMITSAATRIVKSYRALRHGEVYSAVRYLTGSSNPKRGTRIKSSNALADNWLELQYGWKPLLSDIKSAAEMLASQIEVPRVKRYVATVSEKHDLTQPAFGVVFPDAKSSTSRRITAYIASDPATLPVLSGILDPELVAWELVPFSFVVDWVIPVGDYLTALGFAHRLSGNFVLSDRFLWSSGLRQLVDQPGYNLDEGPSGRLTGIALASQPTRVYELKRRCTTVLSVPFPEVKPFGKIASIGHCLNALALFTPAFKNAKPPKV